MSTHLYETPYGNLLRREARAVLAESQNHRCCYCGCQMTDPDSGYSDPRRCTIEHIVPRSRGGTNGYDNVVAACSACNSERCAYQDMHAIAFYYARSSGAILTRRERKAAEGKAPSRKRGPSPYANLVARDATGNVVATFLPKASEFLEKTYPQPKPSIPQQIASSPTPINMSRRARKKAMLALVGHDVPFGHNRLPKKSTPVRPIEGATLGSLWPKAVG